jgi:hypothetical protein
VATASDDPPDDDSKRWHVLQHRRQQVITAQAVEFFRSHNIEPLVIKGISAARYYPESVFRSSVDVDLAVSAEEFSRAQNILDSGAAPVPIDLHRELRQLDTTKWTDLISNSVELALPEGKVRVLRPEDDLRVLAVHWLTDGGTYKDRLWDIFYLIGRREPNFDWDRCLGIVTNRRRRWIECAAGLAAKYLDLDLTKTPLAGAAGRLPTWLTCTVEREWAAEVKPIPLEAVLDNRAMLFKQLLRRLRPNPIYATIDCEGDFDARTRIFYQLRNGLGRIIPSYRRVSSVLRARLR